jgi:hypothetical protein
MPAVSAPSRTPADFLQRALMRLKRRVLRREDDGLIAYAVGVVFRTRKP